MQSQIIPVEQTQWWRLPRVIEETGLSRSTIYRRMDDGSFPKSKAMRSTRAKVWLERDVWAWKRTELLDEAPPKPSGGGALGDLL